MRHILLLSVYLFALATLHAQGYKTTTGKVGFFSDAPVEDITAENQAVTGLFNLQSGNLAFLVPISAFRFPKSLMQEHFNERFMESYNYPEATFAGKVSGYVPTAAGPQDALAEGTLTIHGLTKPYRIPGTLSIEDDRVLMNATFVVKLEDHAIEIPSVLFYNIAEQVEVTAQFVFEKIEK
ncbi:YceI-like domain-containing protein [Cyclobacterium xiamenense]|uniref:YceI-like domain-containing protein n=1 Tax=Cyclobacterium xiamenense TaxID=1297121 RepID=A0A1H6TEU5_9BACT|nr:YceI family protein [Cyclobacterium xiamenense]SEI78531.1 YceI-like domain-containing protein [Cyclobacterium xiamenense]